MRHILSALALTGATLSMYFTYQMLSATFAGAAAIGAVLTALLFQTSQYVYTFHLPTIKERWAPTLGVTAIVATLYVLSVAASYLYMEKMVTDEINAAQEKHTQAQKLAGDLSRAENEEMVRRSSLVRLAQDEYDATRAIVATLDTEIEAIQAAARTDIDLERYRTRGVALLETVAPLRDARKVAATEADATAARLRVALASVSSGATVVFVAEPAPMFKQVGDATRQVLLLLIATLIEVCTLTALLLRGAWTPKAAPVATKRVKPQRPLQKAPPATVRVERPAVPPRTEEQLDLLDEILSGKFGQQPTQRGVIRATGEPDRRVRGAFKHLLDQGQITKEGKVWTL